MFTISPFSVARSILIALSVLGISLVPFGVSAFTIFLDFNGHPERGYPRGSRCAIDLNIPAFDLSVDPNAPTEIVKRVREDFAPFEVTVSQDATDDVGTDINAGIRVVIGGSSNAFGTPCGNVVPGVSTVRIRATRTPSSLPNTTTIHLYRTSTWRDSLLMKWDTS